MLQLTHRGPPELRSNSRRMQSILQARTWDDQSIFDSDVSNKDYAPRPRGTRTRGTRVHFVNSVGHEMVSLVPPGLRKAIQFETRSVSFLIV